MLSSMWIFCVDSNSLFSFLRKNDSNDPAGHGSGEKRMLQKYPVNEWSLTLPCFMNSATMQMGRCSMQRPYSLTRLECCNLVITLASSMKSYSDMVPSFISLTATSILPFHLPCRTTPNWPDPSSSINCNSDALISHDLSMFGHELVG